MKKRLLIILGAGSSIALGIPSVATLDGLMQEWARDWTTLNGFSEDYFSAIWSDVEAYYQVGRSNLRPSVNFEKILGDMVALAHWMEPAPWGDTLRKVACDGAPPLRLRFPVPFAGREAPYGPIVMVLDQLDYLLSRLAKRMRSASLSLDATSASAQKYNMVFERLRKSFEVGIYNLNYDTAALAACPNAYTGFDEAGNFRPKTVHRRSEWNFVYHLHGSVHHSLRSRTGGPICWRRDLADAKSFIDSLEGSDSDKRSEGKSFPRTALIAGGFKLDQLLIEPFHSFYATLVRHIYEADAILIAGYGFGDVHVNRALQNRVALAPEKPPVVVLGLADEKTDPMTFRCDLWSHQLRLALGASGNFFLEPGHSSPPIPAELAARGGFEVASPRRVAIWHGGFTNSAERADSIIQWLGGESDDVLAAG